MQFVLLSSDPGPHCFPNPISFIIPFAQDFTVFNLLSVANIATCSIILRPRPSGSLFPRSNIPGHSICLGFHWFCLTFHCRNAFCSIVFRPRPSLFAVSNIPGHSVCSGFHWFCLAFCCKHFTVSQNLTVIKT